jgi:4-amino-4-deoxychorismate lyase
VIVHFKGAFRDGPLPLYPESAGLRFGLGAFETLLYNGRALCRLEAHLERLGRSLAALDLTFEPQDHHEILPEVVRRNGLEGGYARVNLFCFEEAEGIPARFLSTAAPYDPAPLSPLRLRPCPDLHESRLCGHKTMNHAPFILARRRARALGFDDALLLDRDGLVLETAAAALVVAREGGLVAPASPLRLPSIALAAAREILDIAEEPLRLEDLASARHVFVCNSLMGMRPVASVGQWTFPSDEEVCRLATRAIHAE